MQSFSRALAHLSIAAGSLHPTASSLHRHPWHLEEMNSER
jgi:hypothetical protein